MKFYNALFVRIFFLITLTASVIYLIQQKLPYSAIFIFLLILLFCAELYFFIRARILFYDKVILSMLHDDFSASLPKDYRTGNFKSLYDLFEKLRKKEREQLSREHVYTSILNDVDTSILILKGSEQNWSVFLMNDCFSSLFKVPKLSRWEYLRAQLPAFCDEVEAGGFAEAKKSINIRIENRAAQAFLLQTSRTTSFGDDYFIILLDSIQRVVEKKEKDAWVNLMKVISHELMNSLTPIRSLSQSLHDTVSQPALSIEDFADIRLSLETIMNRSNHLQFFVENYRKLTMLPTPDKKPININTVLQQCLIVMSPMLKQEGIDIENTATIPNPVNADKQQLEQVFINLITNSIYALKDKEDKKIFISSAVENNRVFVTISDTGKGVEKEIREKIFLPFFTTRKDGAGIGLTLSKNIIEAHGGYLSFQSEGDRTSFVICLIAN